IGPDPRNFNQRVSLGRNDLLIRTFPNTAPPRNPVAPVINNVFMNAVSLWLVDWILGAKN
ncbi:hypothetical protein QU904_15505, partial [Klebsiella oxytoca]